MYGFFVHILGIRHACGEGGDEGMKAKIGSFCKAHPLLACVLIEALFLAALQLAGWTLKPALMGIAGFLPSLVIELVAVGAAAALTAVTGMGRIWRDRPAQLLRGLPAAGFLLVISGLQILASIRLEAQAQPLGQILAFTAYVLAVGAAEEIVFRGLVTNILLRRYGADGAGLFIAVALSGVLFGASHLVNILAGIPAPSVLFQAICVMPVGMLFSAIYLRTRSLWLTALVHALVDFSGLFAAGIYGASMKGILSGYSVHHLVAIPVYLAVTLFLLRGSKQKEIIWEDPGEDL